MRKLYVSVDMEGIACVCSPREVDMSKGSEYEPFRRQMSLETNAACSAAFDSGIEEIFVKDAHWTGRNIDPSLLTTPQGRSLRLIRGWSGHPSGMVQEIDETFSAAAFVGFHSAGGHGGNPLSHTINGGRFVSIELNGAVASEFEIYGMAAAMAGVPVAFLSGDAALCQLARERIPGITTVEVLRGAGASSISIAPDEAVRKIGEGVRAAIAAPLPGVMQLPDDFHCRITFCKPHEAYGKSFLPGARLVSDHQVVFESRTYSEVLTFLWFAAQ